MNDTQRAIIRQNALTHADAVVGKFFDLPLRENKEHNDMMKKAYFAFAEECENWVLREVTADIEAVLGNSKNS